MKLRTSLRCIESIPDHRARIASVSASRSMRHPPASPSLTARNVMRVGCSTPFTLFFKLVGVGPSEDTRALK
jgi:hypothetical protein